MRGGACAQGGGSFLFIKAQAGGAAVIPRGGQGLCAGASCAVMQVECAPRPEIQIQMNPARLAMPVGNTRGITGIDPKCTSACSRVLLMFMGSTRLLNIAATEVKGKVGIITVSQQRMLKASESNPTLFLNLFPKRVSRVSLQ